MNIDENNITKQSVAKIREGKLSMAKPSSLHSKPVRRFGAKFSDDEDDNNINNNNNEMNNNTYNNNH